MDIKLRLINRSNAEIPADIVVFQKNVAANIDEPAVAWQVIHNLQQGNNHPFVFAMDITIAASDSWGNFTSEQAAQNGQLFTMQRVPSNDRLVQTGDGTSPYEVQCLNGLSQAAINAHLYRSGKMLAAKTDIVPGQKAVFQLKPTIWVGVASQVEEAQVMNSAIHSSIDTELWLLGIASADIVMTGGGSGAAPFEFSLENVVMA